MSNRSKDWRASSEEKSFEIRWKGAQVFSRLHALNERSLELLVQVARTDRRSTYPTMVNRHRSVWRTLSNTQRRRAASVPFLLLDVNFQDGMWWRSVTDARAPRRQSICQPTIFSGKTAGELMRETLMVAWSTVAFNRSAACLLLGMSPAVGSIVADLGPRDVERIAARHSRHLQVRWAEFPEFWGRLLAAVKESDDDALHLVQLHGLQLLGREVVRPLDVQR